jgi:hypothetical protein
VRLPLALTCCMAALAACAPARGPAAQAALGTPVGAKYLGVETRLLEGDLVSFVVRMQGARGRTDAVTYARCAAAQYTLIRGYTFARHVRTTVTQTGDTWVADGVYTISANLPLGMRNIDAEVIVADCREQGIPTV